MRDRKRPRKGVTIPLQKSRMLKIQGVKGEAVVDYCEPLTTPKMPYHRLSRRVNNTASFPLPLDLTDDEMQDERQKWPNTLLFISFHTFRRVVYATLGFTLLESLMAVFFLGLMAAGVTAVYSSGFQSLDDQMDGILLDSKVRSRMEVLVGTEFDSLSSGSEVVTVNGKDYTINWSVTSVDLNGDGITEPTAKKVTVSVDGLPGHALTTILVDNENKVGKIS
jgi:hypothetical protein